MLGFDSGVHRDERRVGPDRVAAILASAEAAGFRGPQRAPLATLPPAQDLATTGPLAQLASELLGAGAFPVRSIWFDKPPERNWPVLWHQDKTIAVAERHSVDGFGPWSVKRGVPHVEPPSAVLAAMVTLRLYLDDCGPDDGPLRIVPHTHHEKLTPEQIAAAAARGPLIECTGRAGDVLAMRPLIVHSSTRAAGTSRRRVLHVEYACTPLPAPLRWAAAR